MIHGCADIPDLFRVSSVEHGISRVSANTRNKSGIFKHPFIFLFIINYRFSTNIKCPEAMIGDCLKSDNFHMRNYHE